MLIIIGALSITTLIILIIFAVQLKQTSQCIVATDKALKEIKEQIAATKNLQTAEDGTPLDPESSGENAGNLLATVTSTHENIKKYDAHFSALAKGIIEHQRDVDERFTRIDHFFSQLDGTLNGIRDYLSTRHEQMVRLQEGYDYAVIKNFSKQIIQCVNQLDLKLKSPMSETEEAELKSVSSDLMDILERYGLERFTPEVGSSFSRIRKIAESSSIKEYTDDDTLVGKVAEVIRPGYRYVYNHDKYHIISPAQVKIYELKGS